MSGTTREAFVANLSQKLGRTAVPEKPIYCAQEVPTPVRITDGLSQAELVDLFVQQATNARVKVTRCSADEVAAAVQAIIAEARAADAEAGETAQQGPAVFADDPKLDELGVPGALGADAIRWNPEAGHDAMLAACNQARFGVTYTAGAIAETGTIAQPCSPTCGRSISLLPLAHIAIVDASGVQACLGDAMRDLEQAGGDNLPSQVCYISGMSVTSDIELVRVEGVHGPMYVYYIVVEDK